MMKAILLLGLAMMILPEGGWAQAEAPAGGKLLPDVAYMKIVKGMIRDRAGDLWLATSWAGAFRFDGKTFTRFSAKDGLASDMVNVVFEDDAGQLWFGTANGVFRFDRKTFSPFPLQAGGSFGDFLGRAPPMAASSKNVTSIARDGAGNLWFGIWGPPGEAGAYRYDGKQLRHFLPGNPTQGLVADDAGGVWLNSQRYDGTKFTDFSVADHAFKDAVFTSLKDRAGNLWFGVRDDGLYRYDGKAFTWFSAKEGTFERVTSLFEDSSGLLWVGGDIRFGTNFGGLAYYDGKSFVHVSGVRDLGLYGVWAITQDRTGALWFGGRGGKLLRYDGKTFTDFSDALNAASL